MKYLFYICVFAICSCQNFSSTKPSTLVNNTLPPNGVGIKEEKKYWQITDTTFSFNYKKVQFTAVYTGIGKYRCGLDFIDTVNHTSYHWVKLAPGFSTWTEEGHIDFSAIQLLFQGRSYYIPSDLHEQQFTWLLDSDTMNILIDAWYITGIDNHPVNPSVLIKNVKKV